MSSNATVHIDRSPKRSKRTGTDRVRMSNEVRCFTDLQIGGILVEIKTECGLLGICSMLQIYLKNKNETIHTHKNTYMLDIATEIVSRTRMLEIVIIGLIYSHPPII